MNRIIASIPIEALADCPSFRHLSTLANVRVDLRYATVHNFMGRNVYAGWDCAWLHVEAAAMLERACVALLARAPDLRLVVLDGLRPHRIQCAMWEALAGTGLQSYLAPPELGSLHSYGMAVDVTLAREDGTPLDMGTAFDAMVSQSHPEHEARHLADGTLTAQHIANRQQLRDVMLGAGFHGIATEWWHFDATADRARVRATYPRVD